MVVAKESLQKKVEELQLDIPALLDLLFSGSSFNHRIQLPCFHLFVSIGIIALFSRNGFCCTLFRCDHPVYMGGSSLELLYQIPDSLQLLPVNISIRR